MAVILDPDEEETWLRGDPDEEETWLRGDPDEAAALLDPYPADELTAYPVSTRVNAPGVDAPELIEPGSGD